MTTRRTFLKQSALIAAVGSTTMPLRYARAQDRNSRPSVAAIGVGGSGGAYNRGGDIAQQAGQLGQLVAVCDVNEKHLREFSESIDGPIETFVDYRVLFDKLSPDVVTIGTPDHWHIPIAIAAMRNGADVYCEKPLTLTIDEGIEVCRVVKETGKVFQVGTQQRSEYDNLFLKAVAIVQKGMLGDNVNAFVAIDGGPTGGPFASTSTPDELHWDMWLGPAPKADYCLERQKEFRWFFEYSGGKMTDWGAHNVDIAQWALGHGNSGPISVKAQGSFPPVVPDNFAWDAFLNGEITLPTSYNTARKFNIDLKYQDGSVISVNDYYNRNAEIEFGNGILFEGEKGRIFVNRGRLSGKVVEEMTESESESIDKHIAELFRGKQPGNHMANFFSCLEDRGMPISDVFSHHRTMTACHLCNISLMLGREVRWDPKTETFQGDDQATKLRSRRSREGYAINRVAS